MRYKIVIPTAFQLLFYLVFLKIHVLLVRLQKRFLLTLSNQLIGTTEMNELIPVSGMSITEKLAWAKTTLSHLKSKHYALIAKLPLNQTCTSFGKIDLTIDDLMLPELCPVLGIPLSFMKGKIHAATPSIDRFDSSKGYILGNITTMSFIANTLKNNIYDNNRLISGTIDNGRNKVYTFKSTVDKQALFAKMGSEFEHGYIERVRNWISIQPACDPSKFILSD